VEFSRISGVGDKKLREFGEIFLGAIATHLQTNARQIFADDSFSGRTSVPSVRPRSKFSDTARETLHFFRQGKTISEIARIRGVKDGTIHGHLEEAILFGENINVDSLVSCAAQKEIIAAFQKHGFGNLGGVVESLGGKYDYGQCRLVRAVLQAS
jgi:ATP-dependent DNA helicase RecQ